MNKIRSTTKKVEILVDGYGGGLYKENIDQHKNYLTSLVIIFTFGISLTGHKLLI